MRKLSPFMQTFEELPITLPIFPLANAVVIPDAHLPLNIFEPRYLNMIEDAMKSHRLIGMIQPKDNGESSEFYNVGCAARITRYEETSDGRLEISLGGLCRFEIKEQKTSTRGYHIVVPDWSKYEKDYDEQEPLDSMLKYRFISSLRNHFKPDKMEINWQVMEKLSIDKLFHTLFYLLDLSIEDKQMLVEMDTLEQRLNALTAIFEGIEDKNIVKH